MYLTGAILIRNRKAQPLENLIVFFVIVKWVTNYSGPVDTFSWRVL